MGLGGFEDSDGNIHTAICLRVVPVQALVLKLTAGDYFGEIALLSGKPRQASVKATGQVTVLLMHRDAFTRLCGNLFDILKRNMSKYSDMELPADAPEPLEEEAEEETIDEGGEEDSIPAAALAGRSRGRRTNVFVEAVKIEDDWVAPTYEKSDAEKAKLNDYLSKTALLAYLDPKSKITVIDAFQKKSFTNGVCMCAVRVHADGRENLEPTL